MIRHFFACLDRSLFVRRHIGLSTILLLILGFVAVQGCSGGDSGQGIDPFVDGGNGSALDATVTSDGGGSGDSSIPTDGGANDSGNGADAADGAPSGLSVSIINDAEILEGNSGQTTMAFRVRLSEASKDTVTVNFATVDGTATSGVASGGVGGADYTASSGTVTFAPGDVQKTIIINVSGDVIPEDTEIFTVVLSNAVNASILQGVGKGTITNDDTGPTISINNALVTEGNAGTTPAVFNVTLSKPSAQTITVHAKTTDLTATIANNDYTAIADVTLTFNPGETLKTVTVNVIGDVVVESNEAFTVNLSLPINATLVTAIGTGTIQNDDGAVQPSISITDVGRAEGNVGTATMTFVVTLSASSAQTVTVDFVTTDGTATAGGVAAAGGRDYVASSNTLTFLPGVTTQNISITINGDLVDESTETFTVDLSNAVNAIISKVKGTGTITTDDAAPAVTIANAAIDEGQAGTKALTFTISLSATSGKTVTVNYATSDGTATAGGALATGGQDYVSSNGTINFLPGTATQTVSVIINGDALNEADETLSTTISAPVNATLGVKTIGTGTITNDDPLPLIVINDVAVLEGNLGNSSMVFNVSLVNAALVPTPSGRTVSVAYTTAAGSATSGTDFVATSGTLNFSAGQTAQIITVQIVGDTTSEASETLSVNLSAPVAAAISDGVGIGTITNDDGALPFINVADTSVTEGNTGTTTQMTFTVTLNTAAAADVTVDYATADGTATSGGVLIAGGQDYVPTNGTITFTPGQLSKTVSVTINGDVANEGPDSLQLVLSNASGNAALQTSTGVGTITNDDALPSLSIGDATTAEGNAGTSTATFTVTLSAASGQPVAVSYATADGSAQAGGLLVTGGQDYTPASSTLDFAPGETTKTLSVTVNGDVTYEPAEAFSVTLSAPVNATLGTASGTGAITNDDTLPSITINDVSLAEGSAGGATAFTFTVTLSNPNAQAVTMAYTTADGTASHVGAQSDYTLNSGVLSLAPGTTTDTITVLVVQDVKNEGDDTFFVNLTTPVGASISDGNGLGTILNDD